MPIIIPTSFSAPVFYPESDYTVVKYMDITKFISLLYKKSLFFCRVDKLEDKFEGKTAKPNYQGRVDDWKRWRESPYAQVKLSDDELIEKVKEDYEFEEKQRSLHCIDCWNKKDNESAALWKIYSDFSKGIMVQSSIARLRRSFEQTSEQVQLSEIKYIHYENQVMPDGNSNYPFLYKQIAYSYEKEVRLIYKVPTTDTSGWKYDWEKEEVEEGLYIKTDLNELIEKIVISPYSPEWYFELIRNIIKKYDLDKPVTKSEFSVY